MEYQIKTVRALFGAILLMTGILFLLGCSAGGEDVMSYKGSETEMFGQVLDDFIAALDARDTDAIKDMLAPSVRNSDNLDEQIIRLFEFYPGQTQGHDWDGKHVQGQYRSNFGFGFSQICNGFTLFAGDVPYYCHLTFRYSDTFKNEIGIQRICIVSEKEYCSEGFSWPQESGIHVIEDAEGDYQTRRVGGNPVIYTPMERSISEDDITTFLAAETDFAAFTFAFGVPNAEHLSNVFPIYELTPVDGETRYAYLWLHSSEGNSGYYIDRVQIMNSEEALYYLWRADSE